MLGYIILLSRQLNTVMMLIFFPTDTQMYPNSYQNHIKIFIDINELIIKFICKGKGIRVAKINVCCIYVNGLILLLFLKSWNFMVLYIYNFPCVSYFDIMLCGFLY